MNLEFELVLPCYNEARSLPKILDKAVQAARQNGYAPENFQLVLVENGSTDDSKQVLRQLAQGPNAQWFRSVVVPINRGYGAGIWSGLKTTKAPYVGWSHSDEQTDPIDAFEALNLLKRQTNVRTLVKGKRSGRDWKDRWVTHVFESLAQFLLGVPIKEINAQPKVFPRELLAKLTDPPKTFAFDLYVLYRAVKEGYHFLSLPVVFHSRAFGVSNWAHGFFCRYRTIIGMVQYMWKLSWREGRYTSQAISKALPKTQPKC